MRAGIKEALKYPAEQALATLERALIARERELGFRPIFVVAPARSGSTLLYQAMARHFELSYFSNAIGRFPDSPVCLAWLLALGGGCRPPDTFSSRRGYIEGGSGPSDGSKIWARWFRDSPQHIPDGVLTARQQREVRATIALFQRVFGAPFVNKTQRNCGRILSLAEIFPEAVFVRVHRNAFDMVRSRWEIYKSRDDEDRLWQSYRPSTAGAIATEDPIEHICQQVAMTEAEIDRDRQALGSRGFFDVHYEEFCRQPVAILERFARFYRDDSPYPPLKRRDAIPSTFTSGRARQLPTEEAAAIRRALDRLASVADGR